MKKLQKRKVKTVCVFVVVCVDLDQYLTITRQFPSKTTREANRPQNQPGTKETRLWNSNYTFPHRGAEDLSESTLGDPVVLLTDDFTEFLRNPQTSLKQLSFSYFESN